MTSRPAASVRILLHVVAITFVAFAAAGCPRPCSSDGDCNEGDVCAVADGKGTCVTAGPGDVRDAGVPPDDDDAGNDVDAGNDAGIVDAGDEVDAGNDAGIDFDAGTVVDAGPQTLQLRGAIEVAPGVMRGGGKALKGRIVAPGAGTSRGGTLKLEAGAAPP